METGLNRLWLLTVLAIFTILFQVSSCDLLKKEKEILDTILAPKHYDVNIRPPGINGTNGPVVVNFNTFIRTISKIDDITMDYDVQITFREAWTDERLKYDDMRGRLNHITLTDAGRVWMPDVFFSNEKEGHYHNIIKPNTYIKIFPSGHVLYSARISLKLSCPMNLQLFPFDKHTCSIRMASYSRTTDDLVMLWKDGDHVQIAKNIQIPKFEIVEFESGYCNSMTNTGEYSCIKIEFLIKRTLNYYLRQIYIPYCILSIVSWLTFWLNQRAVVGRIILGIMALSMMSTKATEIQASLPQVSYMKTIDVWTGVCETLALVALVECIVVHYLSSYGNSKNRNMKRTVEKMSLQQAIDDKLNIEDVSTTLAHRIDVVSRIAFPLLYFLLNGYIFWIYITSYDESEEL